MQTSEAAEAVALSKKDWQSVLTVLRQAGIDRLENSDWETAEELKRLHRSIETQVRGDA
jgi:hypothetical protein